MKTKVIKVRLDPQGIEDAIKELNQYKADLERRVRLLLKEMTDRGVEIARAKVVEHGIIHDTNLTNSINGFVMGNTGFIRVDDQYAVFFEFGTGPVGAQSSHPSGKGTYSSQGWYTRADGKDMESLYGWTPLGGGDGDAYYLTYGQKSKPFMYDTALKLRDVFPQIVKVVFG